MSFERVSEVLDAILDYPSHFHMRNTFLDSQGKPVLCGCEHLDAFPTDF